MVSNTLMRALSRGARAFADTIDEDLASDTSPDPAEQVSRTPGVPAKGSAESMYTLLANFAAVNDGDKRGVSRDEARQFARLAGIDSRGTAGYYAMERPLLETRDGGRWITEAGRDRMARLEQELPGLH